MLYFTVFFSMASFYPLLGKYYKELNFNGTQIGILFSTGTCTAMLIQPLWGMICDKKGKCRSIYMLMQVSIMIVALILPFVKSYYLLLVVLIIHFIFQCGLLPVLDTMLFKDVYEFGKIRLWGSFGFAVMALFSGKISLLIGINKMFFIYSFTMLVALVITSQLKEIDKKEEGKKSSSGALKELMRKDFILFVMANFFLLGSYLAGGSYYSILFTEKMGGMTAFGISYFFIGASEIPFLRLSKSLIQKMGTEKVMILAGFILLGRYVVYGLAKSYIPLLIYSVIVGSFIGLFLSAGAQYLREHVKDENRATAIGIYSSASYGMGAMSFQLSGGVVYDRTNISMIYLFFCSFVCLGILAVILLKKESSKQKLKLSLVKE